MPVPRTLDRTQSFPLLVLFLALPVLAQSPSAADYPSLQEAIDANPGRMVFIPPGDHLVSSKLRISGQGGGLYGYGRIVQTNPEAAILEIEHATGVRIRNLTFTRAAGKEEALTAGIDARNNTGLALEGIRVIDNRSRDAAISLTHCRDTSILDCEINNYKRIAIDDRTAEGETLYGYAFNCIDGTGIMVRESIGTLIRGNRVTDSNLLPTKETKEKYQLGNLTDGKFPTNPGRLGQSAVGSGYVSNWHQGSAIIVTSPRSTSHTLVTDNYLENAAQGVDIHCDRMVCSNNIINHCFIGLKATHGAKNLILSGNMISHVDLWGILLNPGSLSHYPKQADQEEPALPANVDGGTVISGNIVTDFGYGHEFWNWGGAAKDGGSGYAIAIFEGQLAENPPVRDVTLQGNIVYNTGRDRVLVDGVPVEQPPRYRYAVYAGPWNRGAETNASNPIDLHFSGNIFHPGFEAVSNIEGLEERE